MEEKKKEKKNKIPLLALKSNQDQQGEFKVNWGSLADPQKWLEKIISLTEIGAAKKTFYFKFFKIKYITIGAFCTHFFIPILDNRGQVPTIIFNCQNWPFTAT